MIQAREDSPPAGTEAIEWLLLIPIARPKRRFNACAGIACGGAIEDWHRVLKSVCRIEEIAHRSAERLSRAIAINLVIAWRIMLMTLLGRETPELPAESALLGS